MNIETEAKLLLSIMKAETFERSLSLLEAIRREKPSQFANALVNFINEVSKAEYDYLCYRLKLSEDEEMSVFETLLATMSEQEKTNLRKMIFSRLQKQLFAFVETKQIGTAELHELENTEREKFLESVRLTNEEIDLIIANYEERPIEDKILLSSVRWKFSYWRAAGLLSVAPEPSGEELLIVAYTKLKAEKKFKKESDLIRYANRRVKKVFPKDAKPFTKQDITDGAHWFIGTRKKIAAEKSVNDPRARSRVNVTPKDWNNFLLKRFGRKRPEFTKEYTKAVREEAAKIEKQQTAPSSSK